MKQKVVCTVNTVKKPRRRTATLLGVRSFDFQTYRNMENVMTTEQLLIHYHRQFFLLSMIVLLIAKCFFVIHLI